MSGGLEVRSRIGNRHTGVAPNLDGTHALRDMSAVVGRGETVALPGKNGTGKSALIKGLGGIHRSGRGDDEMAFSNLKAHLRLIGARTLTQMFDAFNELCDL